MADKQVNEKSANNDDAIRPAASSERPPAYPKEDSEADIQVTAKQIENNSDNKDTHPTNNKAINRHSITYHALTRKEESNGPKATTRDRNVSPDGTTISSETLDPMSFPKWRKIAPTVTLCLFVFTIGFESSLGSTMTEPIVETFQVTRTLALLNVALYLLGWPIGAILFGPLCRVYGRRWPISIGMLLFAILQIPTGLAKNIETIFICRFLTGVFGSAPLVMAHSIFMDLWTPTEGDLVLNWFSTSLLVGTCLGPIVGAHLITNRGRGWQWVEYTSLIMSCTIWFTVFFIPESSALRLLEKHHSRQKKRGSATRQDLERAREIDRNRISARRLIDVWLKKPVIMLFTEPLLFLTTLPSSIAFGVLYVSFANFTLPYTQTRDWDSGSATLPPFITMILGILTGSLITTYIPTFLSRADQTQSATQPEQHLLLVLIGTGLLPIGLFWFAWTDSMSQHWLLQAVSCFFVGAGIILMCQQSETYTLEIYHGSPYTSSALIATISLRSVLAAAFTMASQAQYVALKVSWATSTWAFTILATVPMYAFLYIKGERLRAASPYTNGVLADLDDPQGLIRSISRRSVGVV